MAIPFNPLLTETAVDLITQKLQAEFNPLLQEIDNQYSDGINLEPVENNSYFISDKIQTLSLPSIYVLFQDHAFQYSDDPNYLESEDRAIVVVTAEEIDAQNLARKMYRYARVLFGVLNLADLQDPNGRLQCKVVPQRLGYTEPGPITKSLQKEQAKYRMECVLELKLKHYEKNLT